MRQLCNRFSYHRGTGIYRVLKARGVAGRLSSDPKVYRLVVYGSAICWTTRSKLDQHDGDP